MTASKNKPELDCVIWLVYIVPTAAIVDHTHKFIIVRRRFHHFKRVISAMAGSVVVRDKK